MAEPRSDTWMPLYIGDYLSATTRLTTEQHGAYLLLLMDYWRNGPPPADDTVLAQIARLTPQAWRKMKPTILSFFSEEDGNLIQRRAERERERAVDITEKRREAGRASAAARANGQQSGNKPPTHVGTHGPANWQQNARPSQSQSQKVPLDEESNGVADPEKVMFDSGVALLTAQGKSEAQARSLLGKWKRDHGCGQVIEMLGAAQRLAVVDIPSWAEGRWRSSGERQSERPIC